MCVCALAELVPGLSAARVLDSAPVSPCGLCALSEPIKMHAWLRSYPTLRARVSVWESVQVHFYEY